MKQENRFVAQLFHYLAPFVDVERELFICVDGGAAKHHAGLAESKLLDANVPDLWFAFCGQPNHTGIEAKVMEKGSISLRQGQIQAWRTNGNGAYRPRFWVATDRDLKNFHCWHHTALLPRLDSTVSTVSNVVLSLADYPTAHTSRSISELALFILSHYRSKAG